MIFLTKLLDLLSPRTCVGCGCRLSVEERSLCASCVFRLPYTNFSKNPYDNELARLFWGTFPIERAAALFYYSPKSQQARIVHTLKYGGRDDVAEHLGAMMARQFMIDDFFVGIDVIVPVPITRRRRWQRGYNQSECIARGISEVTGIPVVKDALCRKTFARSQTQLNVYERQDNVSDAFLLRNGSSLAGKHVLLVDDIITTGSTIKACAQQLTSVSGIKISVAALGFTKG